MMDGDKDRAIEAVVHHNFDATAADLLFPLRSSSKSHDEEVFGLIRNVIKLLGFVY